MRRFVPRTLSSSAAELSTLTFERFRNGLVMTVAVVGKKVVQQQETSHIYDRIVLFWLLVRRVPRVLQANYSTKNVTVLDVTVWNTFFTIELVHELF